MVTGCSCGCDRRTKRRQRRARFGGDFTQVYCVLTLSPHHVQKLRPALPILHPRRCRERIRAFVIAAPASCVRGGVESLFSNWADLRGSHRPDWPSNSRSLVLVSKTTSERPATSIGLRAPAVRAVQGAELCYGQREDEAIHNAAVFSNVY
jgi:hypothetical protein